MLPFYKLEINDDPESGIDFLGFVSDPAHQKDWISFSSENKEVKIRQIFNEEQMIVTGVMISEGTPIYRNDPNIGEHYVYFDAATIKEGMMRFHKNQFTKNVNVDHDMDKTMDGVYMFESFIVDSANGMNTPLSLGQTVRDGSWIASYKVDNVDTWNLIKSGQINGFSIEGFFDRVPVEVRREFKKDEVPDQTENKHTIMNTIKDKILAIFATDEESAPIELAEATTDGGEVISWEGELAIGTMITVMVDDVSVPAPEGAHSLTGELEGISLILDADGMVVEIVEDEPTEEAPEEASEEATTETETEQAEEVIEEPKDAHIEEAMEVMATQSADKFKALEKSNEELTAQIIELMAKVEALEKQPITEPTKKAFKRTEAKKSSIPQNPIIHTL